MMEGGVEALSVCVGHTVLYILVALVIARITSSWVEYTGTDPTYGQYVHNPAYCYILQ